MNLIYESEVPGVMAGEGLRVRKSAGKKSSLMPGSEIGEWTESGLSTTISELKDRYSDALMKGYDASAGRLKAERDEDLREQYIKERQSEAALPEQLAKLGINGGATETTLADLRARYQSGRNAVRADYRKGLFDLGQTLAEKTAAVSQKYDEKWLDYLIDKLLALGEGGGYAGIFNL